MLGEEEKRMEIFCTVHTDKKDCGRYCIGRIQMSNIYALSNMPKRFRKHIGLVPEPQDRPTFIKLRDWMDNVVENVRQGKGLFIVGETKGTGKTTWACKIMNEYFLKVALKNNLRCRGLFINVPQFFQELRHSFDNPSEEFNEILENIRTADLVIWDDIGTESPTNFVRDTLYTYIDYRYANEKSQIFTTNVSIDKLRHDDWIGERTVSRILGSCELMELKAKNDKRVSR